MEERLKRQRRRLLLRVILIITAVWLSVSAVFCAVRLNNEKANIKNRENSKLAYAKQLMSVGNGSFKAVDRVFIEYFDLVFEKDKSNDDYDLQVMIFNPRTGAVIADTAKKVGVCFQMRVSGEATYDASGLLDYDAMRNALSEGQLEDIAKWLNTKRDDGNYYELVCTKFRLEELCIIPLELKIVLVNGKDERFTLDDSVAVYDLSRNAVEGMRIEESGSLRRNTVPAGFLLDGVYNPDLIGSLTNEQRRQSTALIQTGTWEYIFFANDFLNSAFVSTEVEDLTWVLQYARKVNILDNCKADLAIGVAVFFGFFLTIALLLCLMIWRTVKAQIVQEQRRVDLTNALAHDIKTPLFVISGYAYSLKEDIDDGTRDGYFDKIIAQTDGINALVHKMLELSKLDSDTMTLNRERFDLRELVSEILEDFSLLPDGKTVSFAHSGNNTVNADRALIKTALQNVIDNAVKYSPPHSEIKIDLSGSRFSVRNPSESLGKPELKQLWQPYFRKDKSRSKTGNGLGLAIVKSVMELHGAKYGIEAQDGEFVFYTVL